MSDWFEDVGAFVALGAVTIVVLIGLSGLEATVRGNQVKAWRLAAAGVWAIAVLSVGIGTRVDDEFAPCKTTTKVTGESVSRESTSGAGAADKVVLAAPTTETTQTCEPVSVAEAAALLLPALVLLSPLLKNITIPGLGSLDWREEVKKEAVAQAAQQIHIYFRQTDVGTHTAASLREAETGQVEAFPGT